MVKETEMDLVYCIISLITGMELTLLFLVIKTGVRAKDIIKALDFYRKESYKYDSFYLFLGIEKKDED